MYSKRTPRSSLRAINGTAKLWSAVEHDRFRQSPLAVQLNPACLVGVNRLNSYPFALPDTRACSHLQTQDLRARNLISFYPQTRWEAMNRTTLGYAESAYGRSALTATRVLKSSLRARHGINSLPASSLFYWLLLLFIGFFFWLGLGCIWLRSCFGIEPIDPSNVSSRDQMTVSIDSDLNRAVPHLLLDVSE